MTHASQPDQILASPSAYEGNLSFRLLCIACIVGFLDPYLRFGTANFFASDVLFLLGLLVLLIEPGSRRRLLSGWFRSAVAWAFTTLSLFLALNLVKSSIVGAVDLNHVVLEVLQLYFIFFVLAPVILFHCGNPKRSRQLWAIQCIMFAVAGLLSITEYLGWTHLVTQNYFRVNNPLLGVNGFYAFGLLSIFMLQVAIRNLNRPLGWLSIACWLLGFTGMSLAGVRTGLVITGMSFVSLAWYYRTELLRRGKLVTTAMLVLATAALAGGYLALTYLPVFQDRAATHQAGFWADPLRIQAAETGVRAILSSPTWLGAGLGEFAVLHPEIITVHNVLLQQTFESGILGAFAWLAIWWCVWEQPRRQYLWAKRIGNTNDAIFWWCCTFAALGWILAGVVYPLGVSRSDWVIPLLAAGSSQLWPLERETSAPASQEPQYVTVDGGGAHVRA